MSDHSLQEDFEDFFEQSQNGYIIASPGGNILRANQVVAGWLGFSTADLTQQKFANILTIGGRIYVETHLWPLLRLQGHFEEVAVELKTADGTRIPALINARVRKDPDGKPAFIRITLLKALDRLIYEQNLKTTNESLKHRLLAAEELSLTREQLIAILGHDLRTPLSSVVTAASLLAKSKLNATEQRMVQLITRSSARMSELITNIMDFARTRLGDGINLAKTPVHLHDTLEQVILELQTTWPDRIVIQHMQLQGSINCDASRIAQLFSNLLSNALTHGAVDHPVKVDALIKNEVFELTVCNAGRPIPADQLDHIFEPFTREMSRPGGNGLGLGLYICAQIARAHDGTLTVTSDPGETCFQFRMPIA